MKPSIKTRSPSALRQIALIALSFAFAQLSLQALEAADTPSLRPLTEAKAASLPLTATFERATGAEEPPYTLKLQNNSKSVLKLKAKVLLSVVAHNMDKARHLPEHTLEAGKSWSIGQLASDDKIIVTAEGFAPLEISVPFHK